MIQIMDIFSDIRPQGNIFFFTQLNPDDGGNVMPIRYSCSLRLEPDLQKLHRVWFRLIRCGLK